ncbi:MAG: hypothetical protein HC824_01650 [Synechococcales cyanobacterium RM1_1_8]|nr:hypothetical protein [Synechococcales cyanobacterium RM1_1_8]
MTGVALAGTAARADGGKGGRATVGGPDFALELIDSRTPTAFGEGVDVKGSFLCLLVTHLKIMLFVGCSEGATASNTPVHQTHWYSSLASFKRTESPLNGSNS